MISPNVYASVRRHDEDVVENPVTRNSASPPNWWILVVPCVVVVALLLHLAPLGHCGADLKRARAGRQNAPRDASFNINIPRAARFGALDQKGITIWLTGPSSGDTSAIGKALERELILKHRKQVYRLDGDNVRVGLNRDLGVSPQDRVENVRRMGEIASLFNDAGTITLVDLASPHRHDRDQARELHAQLGLAFAEVFVDDHVPRVHGQALRDDRSAPYEVPETPEIHIHTDVATTLEDQVWQIVHYVTAHGYLTGVAANFEQRGYPGTALADGGNARVNRTYGIPSTVEIGADWPHVPLRDEDVHWVQVLGEGWASPLDGFMKEGAYLQSLHFQSVLFDSEKLSSWSLDQNTNFSDYTSEIQTLDRISMSVPIVLPIDDATKRRVMNHTRVALVALSGRTIAWMDDLEVYPHRKEERIARTFGTVDPHHPYIEAIQRSGDFLIGGKVHLVERIRYGDGLDKFRLTPEELRTKFQSMHADVVFTFQTRNPIHAGHAYLMQAARKELLSRGFQNPVLWLSPLGGWTKSEDVPLDVRLSQHEAILKQGMLDPTTTVLSIWPSPMIFAGPREVIWHAKSRKNAGAQCFVTGRDPAGIRHSNASLGDVYAGEHGRFVLHLAPGLEDMSFISFPTVYYDVTDQAMKPKDWTRPDDFLSVSGSIMRHMASEGLPLCKEKITSARTWEAHPDCVPDGFMAQGGWDIMVDYYQHKTDKTWVPYAREDHIYFRGQDSEPPGQFLNKDHENISEKWK